MDTYLVWEFSRSHGEPVHVLADTLKEASSKVDAMGVGDVTFVRVWETFVKPESASKESCGMSVEERSKYLDEMVEKWKKLFDGIHDNSDIVQALQNIADVIRRKVV